MDTQVDGCSLSCLDHLVFELFPYLGHHFLNAGWMYSAIGDELV